MQHYRMCVFFGPIASGLGHFSPIFVENHFGSVGVGRFGPISMVGHLGQILGVSHLIFSLSYSFGENR